MREVLIDTCLIHNLSDKGKNVELFKKIITSLEYKLKVHPYIAEHEFVTYTYLNKLIEEGFIEIIKYDELFDDDDDKKVYIDYFFDIHETLNEYTNGKKGISKLNIPNNQNIFTYRKSKMSLGDVHMVITAFYMNIPVILTDDSDIEILREITTSKLNNATFNLDVLRSLDVVNSINIDVVDLNSAEEKRFKEQRKFWNKKEKK